MLLSFEPSKIASSSGLRAQIKEVKEQTETLLTYFILLLADPRDFLGDEVKTDKSVGRL